LGVTAVTFVVSPSILVKRAAIEADPAIEAGPETRKV